MASFTDNIPQFNPYVSQQPVQAMVQVGMAKQQQYDTNLQKIQQSMSNISGLQIARDVDKHYLEQKMGEMSKQLNVFASSDLSSNNLTSHLRGMIGGIAQDEVVRNSVNSTMKYQSELKFMQKEKEEGNLTPDNEFHFQKQAQSWFTDETPGSNFNGKYVKHFDVLEYTREVFNDVKPDGLAYDDVFSGVDAKGNPTMTAAMTRMKKEGIFPEKAAKVIDQIMNDPRVNQQLQISGEYNYKNYTPEMLQNQVRQSTASTLDYIDTNVEQLKIRKAAGEDVQDAIDNMITRREQVITTASDLESAALNNPDAVRGKIHTANTRLNYNRMFSNVKTESQLVRNPVWWGNFEVQKEANTQARHRDVLRQNKLEFEWSQQMDLADLDMDRYKADLAAGKVKGVDTRDGAPTDPGVQTQEQSTFDVVAFQKNLYNKAEQDYTNSANDLIWETLYREDYYKELNDMMQKRPELTSSQAKAEILKNIAAKDKNNTIDQDAGGGWSMSGGVDMAKFNASKLFEISQLATSAKPNSTLATQFEDYWNKKTFYEAEKAENDQQKKQFTNELAGVSLPSEDISFTFIDRGVEHDLNLSPDDVLDIAIVKKYKGKDVLSFGNEDSQEKGKIAREAEDRLKSKYGAVAGIMPLISSRDQSQLGVSLANIQEQLNDVDFGAAIENRRERAKARLGKDPNLSFNLFGGKPEFNEGQRRRLQNQISAYVGTDGDALNLADKSKFDQMVKLLSGTKDFKELDITMSMATDANGEKRAYVHNIDNSAGAYISWDNAVQLRPELATTFVPEKVSQITTVMKTRNGATSFGDPKAKSTYADGGGYFQQPQFPGMVGSQNLFVQGNFEEDHITGQIIPYIYVKQITPSGYYHEVFQLNPAPNIGTALNMFKDPSVINPITVAQMIAKQQTNQTPQQ